MDKILLVIFVSKWGDRLDKFTRPRYSDSISWLKDEPYCRVSNKAQYENPEDHFVTGADKIRAAHSLQADIHWIRDDHHSRHSMNAYEMFAVKREITQKVLEWILSAAAYVFLILLGTITLGVFWPKDFRKFVLSSGTGGNEVESDSTYTIIKDKSTVHSKTKEKFNDAKDSANQKPPLLDDDGRDGPRHERMNHPRRRSIRLD